MTNTIKNKSKAKSAGRLIKLAVLTALSIIAFQAPAWADTLELNSGTVLTGTFLGGTVDTIRFDDGSRVLTFARSEILSLNIDGGQAAAQNQAPAGNQVIEAQAPAEPAAQLTTEPVPGQVFYRLPDPVSTVRVDGGLYYYHGGYFYTRHPRGYTVVSGPVGALVPFLPQTRVVIDFGGLDYYYFAGIYYQWRPWLGMYVVVSPPYGIYVQNPPWGSVSLIIGGNYYWRYGGYWYNRHWHRGGWRYKVVRKPPRRPYDRDRGQVSVMPILPGKPSTGQSNYNPGQGNGQGNGRGRVAVNPPNRGNSGSTNYKPATGNNNGRLVSGPHLTKPGNNNKVVSRPPTGNVPGYGKGTSTYGGARASSPSASSPARSAPSYSKGFSGGGSQSTGKPAASNPGRGNAGIRRMGG